MEETRMLTDEGRENARRDVRHAMMRRTPLRVQNQLDALFASDAARAALLGECKKFIEQFAGCFDAEGFVAISEISDMQEAARTLLDRIAREGL